MSVPEEKDINQISEKITKIILKNRGNYNKLKKILNELREKGYSAAVRKALIHLEKTKDEFNDFYSNILEAENIAEVIRGKMPDKKSVDDILRKNLDLIKSSQLIQENLNDIFASDPRLKIFAKEYKLETSRKTESEVPIKDLISSAEDKILNGEISGIYNEIEKTENLISKNIPQAMINIYNSFQVMDNKKKFVEFIIGNEKNSVEEIFIGQLQKKALDYRNAELPKKWNEMTHKIQFTQKEEHFKAWYHGLQQGRYENVVSDVKEFIVKTIIKKIVEIISIENKDIHIKKNNFIKLLENNKTEDVKKEYKHFFSSLKSDKKNIGIVEIFDLFFLYYIFLNYDLSLEKEIFSNLFVKLGSAGSVKKKIDILEKEKKEIIKSLNNDKLKKSIGQIFDGFLNFYKILNEKKEIIKEVSVNNQNLLGENNKEISLKETFKAENVKGFVEDIFKDKEILFDDKILEITNVFGGNDLDYKGYIKGFEAAEKHTNNKEEKNKIKEIVEVIRRLAKEVEPLFSLESKIGKINEWIRKDYGGNDEIINFLKKEIERFDSISGREDGLLSRLFIRMKNADDKIKYLKEMLGKSEYKNLIPIIKNLIENFKKETAFTKEKINPDYILKNLERKSDDEKLVYLKTRKEWDIYSENKDFICEEIEKVKSKIGKVEGEIAIIKSIFEAVEKILELSGVAERQKYINFQMKEYQGDNKLFIPVMKLLFYLFSAESSESKKRIFALTDRVKLTLQEKQKYLQLLKNYSEGQKSLYRELGISSEDIAFGAAYILFQKDSLQKRIAKLENFKKSGEEGALKYKEFFEITDKIFYDILKFLNEKVVKKDEAPQEIDLLTEEKDADRLEYEEESSASFTEKDIKEIEKKQVISQKSTGEIIKEQKIREDFKKINEFVIKKLDEEGAKTNKETLSKIREKAHQLSVDKIKEEQDKLSELLTFLTTCFPEAVSRIITDEILPVFREDAIDLEIHNLIENINDSIFKAAMSGREVEKNIEFFKSRLTENNLKNIKTIVNRIKDRWNEESEKLRSSNVESKGFEKAVEVADKINKAKDNKNFKSTPLEKKEIPIPIKEENIKSSDFKIENNVEKVNIETKSAPEEVQTIKESEALNDKKNIQQENEFSETAASVNGEIEEILSGLTNFIKPHLIILNFVRQNPNFKEEDFDVDKRREIIDDLFNRGKIFTYDGSTYVGTGQISNIIKSNSIPSTDRAMFIKKLDAFITRFKSNEEFFQFLGVQDEMEFRQLNFAMDKYGPTKNMVAFLTEDKEVKPEIKTGKALLVRGKEKTKEVFEKSKEIIKKVDEEIKSEIIREEKINKKEKPVEKIKKKDDKKEKDIKNIKKEEAEFISGTQKELLAQAFKEINKNLEKLIKQAETKNDLDAVYRNYFGQSDANRKNLLNLCYDIKKIAEIINKDKFLFSKLSFDKAKMQKLFDAKAKKIKK